MKKNLDSYKYHLYQLTLAKMKYAIEKELERLDRIRELEVTPKNYYSWVILRTLSTIWDDAADLANMAEALEHCKEIILETLKERKIKDESTSVQD